MLIAPFNDPYYLRSLLAEHGDEIAGIIVEPLQRIIPPEPEFLQFLRDEADKYGIVLIFNEVVTGFRFAYGGAQGLYGVASDVATLGKIIDRGFPLAVIAGRADIMAYFDKATVGADKWFMQFDTLSGNPVAAIAGLKTMEILRRDCQHDQLRADGKRLMNLGASALKDQGIEHKTVGDPTLSEFVFIDQPVHDYRGIFHADTKTAARFNAILMENGLFKSPDKTYRLTLSEEDFSLADAAYAKAAATIAAA